MALQAARPDADAMIERQSKYARMMNKHFAHARLSVEFLKRRLI